MKSVLRKKKCVGAGSGVYQQCWAAGRANQSRQLEGNGRAGLIADSHGRVSIKADQEEDDGEEHLPLGRHSF